MAKVKQKSAARTSGALRRVTHLQPVVFFLIVWAWAWLWWGDVLWTAHERSFFATESLLMDHVWSQSFGLMRVAGRALLSLCAWPWLGGAIMAALLTGIACCLKYTFVRRNGTGSLNTALGIACYLVPTLWIAWLAFLGFDTYYKGEPGRIFGIPAMMLVVFAMQAALVWTFRHRRKPAKATPRPATALPYPLMAVIVVVAGTMIFEKSCRPWVRPTAKMERLYDAEDWTGIRRVALDNATVSCRPMAAYYAIALVKQNELMNHLFDIRFEYDDIYMHDWNGELMNNTPYYVVEADMHAGLLQFAYHKAIEDMTMDGPTIHNLKTMVQITAMRREELPDGTFRYPDTKICRKYLDILDGTPGTADFVEKWRGYLDNPRRMEADRSVASIRLLEPMHDAFESAYTDPAFLGYNLQLMEGRSTQALTNSIAVCLYTKLMPPFLERAQYMGADGIQKNSIIADALSMKIQDNPDILRALPGLRFNQDRYRSFVRKMQTAGAAGNTEQRMPYAEQFWREGQGYYPYYYYFGNLKATRKDAAEKYGYGRKDGVN